MSGRCAAVCSTQRAVKERDAKQAQRTVGDLRGAVSVLQRRRDLQAADSAHDGHRGRDDAVAYQSACRTDKGWSQASSATRTVSDKRPKDRKHDGGL